MVQSLGAMYSKVDSPYAEYMLFRWNLWTLAKNADMGF